MESLLARCAETVHRLHRPQESHGLHNDENVKSMTRDRKSTRLNSSHSQTSYAVFCLKKKKYFVAASNENDALWLALLPIHQPSLMRLLSDNAPESSFVLPPGRRSCASSYNPRAGGSP